MNQEHYLSLREKHPVFRYLGYSCNSEDDLLEIEYRFSIDELEQFTSTFSIPLPSRIDIEPLQPFLFSLGMVEAISYWKATCSPTFSIECRGWRSSNTDFWSTLFYLGLGEFRFLNGIDLSKDEFVSFSAKEEYTFEKHSSAKLSGTLIPIGGGKDSIVTTELLSPFREDNHLFLFNPRPACIRTAEIAGYGPDRTITVKRTLDKRLLELNDKGYLNGHTPFSALLAFTGVLVSEIYQKKFIALSNEESASESNVSGTEINHQYSKSLHFEEIFREYVRKQLKSEVEYLSFLRPLNELQIGSLFSSYPQYFAAFRSCNVGCYTDSWCGSCPKCLFTYLLLSPFVPRNDLNGIFGKDLLEDESLQETLRDLFEPDRTKPFECVGTREEVDAILHWLLSTDRDEIPILLAAIRSSFPQPATQPLETLLSAWNENHFLSKEMEALVTKALDGVQDRAA